MGEAVATGNASTAATPPAAGGANGATAGEGVSSAPAVAPGSPPRDAAGRFKAAEAGATPPPAEPAWKPWKGKLTVFGREEEASVDSEDDLRRELQLARAARVKLKELAQRERLLKEESELDPVELLKRRNVDPLEVARRVLSEAAKRELMTPEERAAHEAKGEAEAAKAEVEKLKKAQAAARVEAAAERLWATLQPEFEAAIAASGLPKSPGLTAAIGRVGREFLDAGVRLSPAQVVAEVKRQRDADMASWLSSLDADGLYAALGQERFEALVRRRAERLREAQGQRAQPAPSRPAPQTPRKTYLTEEEWRAKQKGA